MGSLSGEEAGLLCRGHLGVMHHGACVLQPSPYGARKCESSFTDLQSADLVSY